MSCDKFLYEETFQDDTKTVIKWGPKDDMSNFLQQTVNCLEVCEMAIECGFSGMSSMQKESRWDQIAKNHINERSMSLNFVQTQDYEMKAKSTQGKPLTSQKFWMFHGVDRKEIYVVFSSQETSAYILTDADVWMMPKHKGIASVDDIPISLFKALVQQDYHLVFTGHSLGGAIAIMATCKLLMMDLDTTQIDKIRCITFGAPLVSYQDLGEMLTLTLKRIIFRYELPQDPVPQLLTAFQRVENPYQEFLVNLMNLLDLRNSFKNTGTTELGQKDFLELGRNQEKIKESGKLGTVFVPTNYLVTLNTQYRMEHTQMWSFLQSSNQPKIYLSEVLHKLYENQFQRYKDEILYYRIQQLHVDLPRIGENKLAGDMTQCRIPSSKQWTCDDLNIDNHPNYIEATFDEKFTKVIVTSKYPHVLGIRYCEVQQYPKWGVVASQVLQDWSNYKMIFVFYSADNYGKLKANSFLKIKLYGCFETVLDINVKAEEFCGQDASEIKNVAYKNVSIQQLYTSAFQACLFKGEGHNPMLQVENLSESEKSSLLQEDHVALVEMLGSLTVNQKCLDIILKETRYQYQNILLQGRQFNTCDTNLSQNIETTKKEQNEITSKLVDLAQMELKQIYHKFKFDLKEQSQNSSENFGAKECVEESFKTLFSLSSAFVWQMQMYLVNLTALYNMTGKVSLCAGYLSGFAGTVQLATQGALMSSRLAIGSTTLAAGSLAFVGLGLIFSATSVAHTKNQFCNFFANSQTMQNQYKHSLQKLIQFLGYELQEQHSIAGLEKKITELCQLILQKDEVEYNYLKSEEKLNQIILEHILSTDTSQDSLGKKKETQLEKLIERKIDCLSKNTHKKLIKQTPSRGLTALLVFIWNNYRIRSCLSKTLTIGVMGGINAGKSTLAEFLGAAIDRTGTTQSTKDATLFQNVPFNGFDTVDYPNLNITKGNDTMKVFYSLADITIIVMNGYNRANEDQLNIEISEIIKTMQSKYSQLGYENTNRRLPVLLLFNQVDKMIFNEDGKDPNDQTLSDDFKSIKTEITDTLKDYSIEESKVYFLFASIKPQLPKKESQERVTQFTLQLQNQFITQQISAQEFAEKTLEIVQRGNSVDRQRLQNVTGCSFFSWEQDPQENPQSIVSILAKMVEDLGDKQGSNSIIDYFTKNNQ